MNEINDAMRRSKYFTHSSESKCPQIPFLPQPISVTHLTQDNSILKHFYIQNVIQDKI